MTFRAYIGVGALLFCQVLGAEIKIVPLVYDDQIYVATEIDVYGPGEKIYKRVTRVNEAFIKAVKAGDYSKVLNFYSKTDGSREKIRKKGAIEKQHRLYKKVGSSHYRDYFLLGGYVFVVTDYTLSGKKLIWRELYHCVDGEVCKRSLLDPGQFFEYAYSEHLNRSQNYGYHSSFDDVLLDTPFSRVFSIPLQEVNGGQSDISVKVGIAMKALKTSLCKCEKQEFVNEEKRILGEYSKFLFDVETVNLEDVNQINALMGKYIKGFDLKKGVPVVSWREGKPRLVHTDVRGYLQLLRKWKKGSPLLYMKDRGYLYLVMVYPDPDKKEKSQFQIVILKKDDEEKYGIYPTGDRKLDTRQLVFSDGALGLVGEIIRQSKELVSGDG